MSHFLRMNFQFTMLTLMAGGWMLLCPAIWAQDSTKALAVLQRVADVRAETLDFSVELEHEIIRDGVRYYRMHVLGDKLRIEQFEAPDFNLSSRSEVTLILGDVAYHFLASSPRADLEKTTRAGLRKTGAYVFTPRQIGLAIMSDLEDDFPNLLYNNAKTISLLSREEWDGVPVEHVEVDRGFSVIGSRIHVETGRVYQLIAFRDHKETQRLEAKFSREAPIPWMPSEVMIQFSGIGRQEIFRNIRATSTSPSPDLFELASLGIPRGTEVQDRELFKRFGTWNGKEVEPYADYENEQMPEETSRPMYFVAGTVTVFLLGMVMFRYLRRRT
jgi:hypothetical protein